MTRRLSAQGGSRLALLAAIGAAATFGMVSSTIYVPALPDIARGLEAPIASVQLTFVGYLLAFSVGMLFLGPLSDRYGRRRVLILGLIIGVLSSVICLASPSVEILIAARVLQGIGACAGLVVGRATIRDSYRREEAAQVIAGLAFVMTVIQALAPILGGYLLVFFGWRADFAAVAIFAGGALLLAWRFIPETRAGADAGPAWSMAAAYRSLLGKRMFVAYACAAMGAHAGSHVFAAGAPAVLINTFAVSPEDYGFYAALPPLGFLVGSFISNRLSRRLGINRMIALGGAVLVPAGVAMLMLAFFGLAGPYAIVGPMIVVCCGSGLVTPNAVAGSLSVEERSAGAASGLTSFLQMGGAASATAALALAPSGSPLMLAAVIGALGLLAMILFAAFVEAPATMPLRATAEAISR
ncbi:MAG TPA: multidrug effflux MFS transporter [Stellaceae bacterium]|nr:multidrug effflux MFS transporter [Stellaceae bacterium]